MRVSGWDIPGVMGWNYSYHNFAENTGRVTYAQNLYDATLDRSYDYDHVGRLVEAHTGSEARGALIGQGGAQDGPYSHSYRYDQLGNMWYRVGWGGSHGSWLEENPSFTNNRRNGFSYDAAGNLSNDGQQSFSYDATGQQTYASATALSQGYDGDGLRAKKVDNGAATYYLRSSVLGGQVIAEINSAGNWTRGYVYAGGQMIAVQAGGVNWVHQDPVTKSQRVTDNLGNVISIVDLDPWGGETSRSSNQAFQPHRYTSYERDANGGDDAMMRRYHSSWNRFDQPDPYDGSYDLSNPQSFNRYAYVGNDPVNFVDPTGLEPSTCMLDGMPISCGTAGMFINSGAGVHGPLNTSQYDYSRGTFVHFTAVAVAGGTATGWIPQGFHYLGGLSWGWTDYSRESAPSWTASFRLAESMGWRWRNGELATMWHGSWYNAHGEVVGYLTQSVETDWNTQLLMAAPFAAALRLSMASVATNAVEGTAEQAALKLSSHATQRMAQNGISQSMVRTGILKGQAFWDPKNGTVNFILRGGFASGKDLLVGTNPITGFVTTVIRGTSLVGGRMVPLP